MAREAGSSSWFGFSNGSSSSRVPAKVEEPQVEITVTPTSAAFYAGETFSVTIAFTCTRRHPSGQAPSSPAVGRASIDNYKGEPRTPASLAPTASSAATKGILSEPRRKSQIGLAIETPAEAYNAEAGPSRLATPLTLGPGYTDSPSAYSNSPYSPGADPSRAGWLTPGSPIRNGIMGVRSPETSRRPSGSRGGRRTQSLALGKGMSPQEMVWALGAQTPPTLPSRRSGPSKIPSSHPHSRKISINDHPSNHSSASVIDLSDESYLDSIPESASYSDSSRSRPQPHRMASTSSTSSSASQPCVDQMDETPRYRPSTNRRIISPMLSSLSPPPSHPYFRSLAEPRETTILWAHTRLVAHFHPSTAYIPPDPLLPLRSLLLHQPIGAGSLSSSASTGSGGSRWQLSFGTGTIGHETKPSLTGSLVGLASSLVYGGSAGSLEEERKKAWNTKDLPVLETARSLLGVDIRLKEGERREYVYTFPIPTTLPPTHRGRAFKFGWDLIISLAVADESAGKGGSRSREIEVPIRVWSHVALGSAPQPYNVLSPIIQNRDQGTVSEAASIEQAGTKVDMGSHSQHSKAKSGDSKSSLDSYARHLLDTLPVAGNEGSADERMSPSTGRPASGQRLRSPSRPTQNGSSVNGSSHATKEHLDVPDSATRRVGRGRKGSFIQGDEELVEEGGDGDGCDQAVEVLSRHSVKAKDGDLVSVFTLLKTTYRLGETILGVIDMNPPPQPTRHVLKFSAYLESNDYIPTALLPPSPRGGASPQPALVRTHADFSSGYVNQSGRLAFNLDIPHDATPGFTFAAGEEGDPGGVEWRIRLAFLVTAPPKLEKMGGVVSPMIVSAKEGDNRLYTATPSLAPVAYGGPAEERKEGGGIGGEELETETVECEIPIKVLPGNTAFRIRPAQFIV